MMQRKQAGSEGMNVTIDLFNVSSDPVPDFHLRGIVVREDADNARKFITVGFDIDAAVYALRFTLYDETFNNQTDTGGEKEHDTAEYPERQRTDGRA